MNPYQYPYYSSYAYDMRQQTIAGQATWTTGGTTTKCNIPWSYNQHMTVAVSSLSPYQCGQLIKVTNPQNAREVLVTVVDSVPNVPANQLNLHRMAFEALGVNPSVGVIPIQFQPSPDLAEEKWGKYLLEVIQVAYPNARVTDYSLVERSQPENNQVKEVYDFVLQSNQGQLNLRGTVIYNPVTDRVISFDFKER
ncbi:MULTISPECIES: DUF3889 domain-containing protein [Gracilibacillus]|uniref:DUF3889 domain-containing protein n=1 Tax=Gracilibacillus TaxID=74385 RepID=UPI000825CCDD|nr:MULTISPECIES: DUF3889 domain-containing protein [Gracilibacillus]